MQALSVVPPWGRPVAAQPRSRLAVAKAPLLSVAPRAGRQQARPRHALGTPKRATVAVAAAAGGSGKRGDGQQSKEEIEAERQAVLLALTEHSMQFICDVQQGRGRSSGTEAGAAAAPVTSEEEQPGSSLPPEEEAAQ